MRARGEMRRFGRSKQIQVRQRAHVLFTSFFALISCIRAPPSCFVDVQKESYEDDVTNATRNLEEALLEGETGKAIIASLERIVFEAQQRDENNRLLGGFVKVRDSTLVTFRVVGDGRCLWRVVGRHFFERTWIRLDP